MPKHDKHEVNHTPTILHYKAINIDNIFLCNTPHPQGAWGLFGGRLVVAKYTPFFSKPFMGTRVAEEDSK